MIRKRWSVPWLAYGVSRRAESWLQKHPIAWHRIARIWPLDVCGRLAGRPRASIPKRLRSRFTMDGKVQLIYCYTDASQTRAFSYDKGTVDSICDRVAAGEVGAYGGVDTWLYQALAAHPIREKDVAIIGSADQGFGPWYESVCLHYGGKPTTIDYNPIEFNDDRIVFLRAPIDPSSRSLFDAAFSISTFEHSGLGRYGDPLDPDGDLEAMTQVKQLLKKGGLLFLTVPLGKDKVIFNAHRIYGRSRLPSLLSGWKIIDRIGFEDALLDRDTFLGWEPTYWTPSGRLKFLHPEYPEYAPVFVLQNE